MKLILALATITLLTSCGGDDSNTTTDTPQTPSAPTATIQSYSQINLSWSVVSDANYYRLSRGDDEIYAGSNTIYNHTGLNDNTFYSYTLSTCTDSSINTCSDTSLATSATTTQTPSATLNDTGIILGGNATGNNSTCYSSITAPQDCHYGRDVSLTLSDSTFTYATDGSKIAKIGAGAAGFDFTKLSSTGTILSASAGSWSCVKDNITGLVWEVKTSTGSADTYTYTIIDGTRTYTYDNIHHENNTYRWGGFSALGRDHTSREGGYNDDWNVLVNGSNSDSLCGFTDWRVPTINELRSIAHRGKTSLAIDNNYFPNTPANLFWSASPIANGNSSAWLLNFNNGYDDINHRTYSGRVRLVRAGE